MNKKGNLPAQAIIFLALWLIASLVWAIWLDGVLVPAAGLVAALAAIGAFNIVININR